MHEQIIAIDDANGNYPIDKLDAHLRNVPHVAVSVFLFFNDSLLLQKRAATKYHSANLWANTVCSHPRWNEEPLDCANRRLKEELGCEATLSYCGLINYSAKVGELYENERVHCYLGQLPTQAAADNFNPKEVAEIQWMSLPALMDALETQPQLFSEWFKIYMANHKDMIFSRPQ